MHVHIRIHFFIYFTSMLICSRESNAGARRHRRFLCSIYNTQFLYKQRKKLATPDERIHENSSSVGHQISAFVFFFQQERKNVHSIPIKNQPLEKWQERKEQRKRERKRKRRQQQTQKLYVYISLLLSVHNISLSSNNTSNVVHLQHFPNNSVSNVFP